MPSVTLMLFGEFTRWILVSNITAWPIAYLAMRQWLHNFACRIDLDIGVFLLSAALALLIAMFTVSFQAVRAAVSDPVKSLRYE